MTEPSDQKAPETLAGDDKTIPPAIQDQQPPAEKDTTSPGPTKFVIGEYFAENGVMGNVGVVNQHSTVSTFSVRNAVPLTESVEKELKELFVGEPDRINRLLEYLQTHRILLLTGDAGSGKTTMALYLSTRLKAAGGLSHATLLVSALHPQMNVSIDKTAADGRSFGGRVTIFSDALKERNREMLAYFGRMDALRRVNLSDTLKNNESFFIFTMSTEDVSNIRTGAVEHLGCHPLPLLDGTLAESAIDRRLERLRLDERRSEHAKAIAQGRKRLVEELQTVPRIASFLEFFIDQDPDLEQALARFKNVPVWFEKDLTNDVDAWCAAVTLAMAHPLRKGEFLSWIDFDSLRRSITDHIRGNQELFPRLRRSEGPPEASLRPSTAESLCDDAFLARCRATITKQFEQLRDVIQFEEATLADDVWATLLTHNRRVLTSLVPLIQGFAEDGTASVSLRTIAARILGRLGELDPFTVTIPIIENWSRSKDLERRALAGWLMQGVFSSRNENYHEVALKALDLLVEAGMLPDNPEATERLPTVIEAYLNIGLLDPKLAMERIGAIAIGCLAPTLSEWRELVRDQEGMTLELSQTSSRTTKGQLRGQLKRLQERAVKVAHGQWPIMYAIEVAVFCLCDQGDSVQILRAMRDWISRGGQATGILVAMMFLQDGIASMLAANTADNRSTHGDPGRDPLLQSLAGTADAVRHVCGFLADLHASIHAPFSLPAEVLHDLRQEFDTCLTNWARNASINSLYKHGVQELFVALTGRGTALRQHIYSLIGGPIFQESEAMKQFAAAVRREMKN